VVVAEGGLEFSVVLTSSVGLSFTIW
jgi:hypothetical protein